jgi:hypothetical protein
LKSIDFILKYTKDKKSRFFLTKKASLGKLTVNDFLIHTTTEPSAIEMVIAKITALLGTISRVEVSMITGLSLPIVNSEMETMVVEGYLSSTNSFSEQKLKLNIKKITENVESVFQYHEIETLQGSSFVKQYQLTDKGREMIDKKQKNSEEEKEELECNLVIVENELWGIKKGKNTLFVSDGEYKGIGPELYPCYEKFLQEKSDQVLNEKEQFKMLIESSNILLHENPNCEVFLGENYQQDSFLLINDHKNYNFDYLGSVQEYSIMELCSLFTQKIRDNLLLDKFDKANNSGHSYYKLKNFRPNDSKRQKGCLINFNLKKKRIVNFLADNQLELFKNFTSDIYEIELSDEAFITRFQITPNERSKSCQLPFYYHHYKANNPNTTIYLRNKFLKKCKKTLESRYNYQKPIISPEELFDYFLEREGEEKERTVYFFEDEAKIESKEFLKSLGFKGKVSINVDNIGLHSIVILESGFDGSVIFDKIKSNRTINRGNDSKEFKIILLPENKKEIITKFLSFVITPKIRGKLLSYSSFRKILLEDEKRIQGICKRFNIELIKSKWKNLETVIDYLRKIKEIEFFIIEEESERELERIVVKGLMNNAIIKERKLEGKNVNVLISLQKELFTTKKLIALPKLLRTKNVKHTFDTYPEEQEFSIEIDFMIEDNDSEGLTALTALRTGYHFKDKIVFEKELKTFSKNEIKRIYSLASATQKENPELSKIYDFKKCLKQARKDFTFYILEEEIENHLKKKFKLADRKYISIKNLNKKMDVQLYLSAEKIRKYLSEKSVLNTNETEKIEIADKKIIEFTLNILPQNERALKELILIRTIEKVKTDPYPKIQTIGIAKSLAGMIIKESEDYLEPIEKQKIYEEIEESLIVESQKKQNLFIEDYLSKEIERKYQELPYLITSTSDENKIALLLNKEKIIHFYFKNKLIKFFFKKKSQKIKINNEKSNNYTVTNEFLCYLLFFVRFW